MPIKQASRARHGARPPFLSAKGDAGQVDVTPNMTIRRALGSVEGAEATATCATTSIEWNVNMARDPGLRHMLPQTVQHTAPVAHAASPPTYPNNQDS